MRKSQVPTLGRDSAGRSFVVPIRAVRERTRPGLPVIVLYGMSLGVLLNERHGAVNAGSHPTAAIGPGNGVGLVPGHGNGGTGLQRKRDYASGAVGLEFQLLGKSGQFHAPSAIATLRGPAGVTRILCVRIGGAGHELLGVPVPPR